MSERCYKTLSKYYELSYLTSNMYIYLENIICYELARSYELAARSRDRKGRALKGVSVYSLRWEGRAVFWPTNSDYKDKGKTVYFPDGFMLSNVSWNKIIMCSHHTCFLWATILTVLYFPRQFTQIIDRYLPSADKSRCELPPQWDLQDQY